MLNFWQSYCPPCTHEAPVVSAVAKQWAGKGVVFVGVDEQDLPGPATAFMQRFDITYPVVSDDGPLVGHYGVTGYPETFFIDKHGIVVPMPATDAGTYCQVGHIIGGATRQTLDAGIRAGARAMRRLAARPRRLRALRRRPLRASARHTARLGARARERARLRRPATSRSTMSTSPLAEQMKREIRTKIAAGWTNEQIVNYFVAQPVSAPQVLADPADARLRPARLGAPVRRSSGSGRSALGTGAWYWSHNRERRRGRCRHARDR